MVRQGSLFQLPVRLPPGWDVEEVDLSPAHLRRRWGISSKPGGSLLLVDLLRPLRAGEAAATAPGKPGQPSPPQASPRASARVQIRLRPAQPGTVDRPRPALSRPGAGGREVPRGRLRRGVRRASLPGQSEHDEPGRRGAGRWAVGPDPS